ncbi:DUF2382 domain-containing protein [Actinomadura hibisca]|uniref:DUF2382 domain-containing protein n=1 Tax=Actinomadura hibisca TaxID=68565 RepID=UPI000836E90C|nr:PRC and DUF2382 domain-containing protein [Actinomadura hibisca]
MQTKLTGKDLMDREVVGKDGSKVGQVRQVYLNDDSGAPEWITVNTGWFGMHESFIPLAGARESDGTIQVSYDKATIKDAPRIEADQHLDHDETNELYRYYGLQSPRAAAAPGREQAGDARTRTRAAAEQPDRKSMRETDAGRAENRRPAQGKTARGDVARAAEVTRSEEQLRVGTETREAGHVRLRKWVDTEQVSTTVPLVHEEVRVEREPLSGTAEPGVELGNDEQEIILHEQRAVVNKETVPVERVRVSTEQVTEEQTVQGEVRREHVEVVDDTKDRPRPKDPNAKRDARNRDDNR